MKNSLSPEVFAEACIYHSEPIEVDPATWKSVRAYLLSTVRPKWEAQGRMFVCQRLDDEIIRVDNLINEVKE